MKIKYTKELLDVMGFFSAVTRSRLKDCFEIEAVFYFVVEPGQIGKAVGKNAVNIKKIQDRLKKKIKVIEFHPELIRFVANVIFPFKVDSITEEEGIVTLKSQDRQTKGLLIGRNAKNLKIMTDVVKRYFTINEIKVK